MSNKMDTLLKAFQSMPVEDLKSYRFAWKLISIGCAFFGVGLLLLACFFHSILFMCVGAVILLILVNASCQADIMAKAADTALKATADK